jgi:hypothetical protein
MKNDSYFTNGSERRNGFGIDNIKRVKFNNF